MLCRNLWRVVRSVLIVLALLATASNARAEEPRRAGKVRLEAPRGGHGPIELRADGEGYSGEFVIVNEGKEPLVVSRIAPRGDPADPRVPPKLVARVQAETLPITIVPGASRTAVVRWIPSSPDRHRQLFGHVLVTTSDESADEVAMGVRAQVPGLLGSLEPHVLSLLVGIPLVGAILALLLGRTRRSGGRGAQVVAAVALGLQTLLAAYAHRGFVPDFSRADGNDGLQFIEHVVWSRRLFAELYFGVDGIGATSLFVTSLVAFVAILSGSAAPRGGRHHATVLVLDAAVMGAVAAMDGLLFVLFSAVTVIAAGLLVGASGGEARRAAKRLLVSGTFAITLLAVAIVAIGRAVDPTLLVDGTKVATTFSLPELSRVALGAKGATLLGAPLVKVCFVLVMGASLVLLAAFPAHRWLSDVLATAHSETGILVATALPTLGLCAFLRIGCAVLPEGMGWGSGVIVAIGAVTTVYGALLALGEGDLRRMAACAATTQAGFVLLGAGSLTPQGLSGAIVLGTTRALACGLFLLLVEAVHERVRTSDASRLGGLAAPMPGWAAALVAASLAQAGVLGFGGAWGPLLALVGVLAGYAPLALAAAVGLVVLAAAHLRLISRVAFAPLDPVWAASADAGADHASAPTHRRRLPDLTAREWASVAPLALLVVVLGLWPAPVISRTSGTVRDLANAVSPPGPDQIAIR